MFSKTKCSDDNCNRKIKLTDFPCKCNNIYCIKHRLPEEHQCTFNFKQIYDDCEKLVKELKIVPEKINKI